MIYHLLILLASSLLLSFSCKLLISGLGKIARYLGWREFVVAFFVVAFASSAPNLFVGLSAIKHGVPELSFGDVVGGNVVDLTLAVALATFFAKKLPAKSRTVQATSLFTILVALLPLWLILDGTLSRQDGLVLLFTFLCYMLWLFSDKERFSQKFQGRKPNKKNLLKDLGKVIGGIFLLGVASEGIVSCARFLAEQSGMDISLIGVLIVGLGNSLPEIYFSISSARAGDTWMILGDLMGSVIMPSTLVLGTVALINPIVITDFSSFAIARIFLIISALFFLYYIRTDKEITKREAIFLLLLYILFLISEIVF
ncbi:MAG: hypothetical protein ABH967_00985 [Patescibacteria group bacterium]